MVELAASVQGGHDDLGGGALLCLVLVNGNAAPVILDRYRIVAVDSHLDVIAVPGQGLVDTVVHNLVDQVV